MTDSMGLRVGVVGVGFGTTVHVPGFQSEGLEVVAIAARRGERAREAAGLQGELSRIHARRDIERQHQRKSAYRLRGGGWRDGGCGREKKSSENGRQCRNPDVLIFPDCRLDGDACFRPRCRDNDPCNRKNQIRQWSCVNQDGFRSTFQGAGDRSRLLCWTSRQPSRRATAPAMMRSSSALTIWACNLLSVRVSLSEFALFAS